MLEKYSLPIDKIHVPVKRRKTLEPARVEALAENMVENGQKSRVRGRMGRRRAEPRFVLIEGLHRREAARALGETTIVAYLVQARLR